MREVLVIVVPFAFWCKASYVRKSDCPLLLNLQGHVIMNTQSPSFYQRVIDKTKGLAFQSQFIAQNVDKRKAVLMQANPSGGIGVRNV